MEPVSVPTNEQGNLQATPKDTINEANIGSDSSQADAKLEISENTEHETSAHGSVKEFKTETPISARLDTIPLSKIKFGSQVNARSKPDGSWNFYTRLQTLETEQQSVLFKTIFSRPTIQNPVPKATACVWFQLIHKGPIHEGSWEVNYRFEHHQQIHSIQFSDKVPYHGFSNSELELIKKQASLIAKPSIRLQELIDSNLSPGISLNFTDRIMVSQRG